MRITEPNQNISPIYVCSAEPFIARRFHQGSVDDVPGSNVILTYYTNGDVDGVIHLPDETYIIEPLSRYLTRATHAHHASPTAVVYGASRIRKELFEGNNRTATNICSSHAHDVLRRRQDELAVETETGGGARRWGAPDNGNAEVRAVRGRRQDDPINCRSIDENSRCSCTVILVADQTFFEGPYGKQDEVRAVSGVPRQHCQRFQEP